MRGPQCSAGTEGEGRPGQGSGGAAPCPVSVAPQGLLWSPSWGRLSLQSDSARPPSVAAAAKAAPAVGVPAGPGLFLSTLLFVFFQCHSKREEKGKKKKRKKLLRDDSELFAKVPFIVMQRGHPSPPGRKDVQHVLRPCLAVALSRVPYPTEALPRGDVALPCGRWPPVGPSPSTPHAICEGLGEQDGASGGLGQLWRGGRLGGKRPAAPWP